MKTTNRLNHTSFVEFTSSITTIICTITKSIITSTQRAFYKNRDFHMNYIVNIGATVLWIGFTGYTWIGNGQIFRNFLPKSGNISKLFIWTILLNWNYSDNHLQSIKWWKKIEFFIYLKMARCKYVLGISFSKMLDEKYNLAVFSSNHDVWLFLLPVKKIENTF